MTDEWSIWQVKSQVIVLWLAIILSPVVEIMDCQRLPSSQNSHLGDLSVESHKSNTIAVLRVPQSYATP